MSGGDIVNLNGQMKAYLLLETTILVRCVSLFTNLYTVSNILLSLGEKRACLRVEWRGKSSCAKREQEGAPTAGEGAPKGGRKKERYKLSERATAVQY